MRPDNVPPLTTDQVLSLAPDPASAKAGTALATPRKWTALGRDDDSRMVWGECQGSGTKPYQTQADLSEPAFRCSCPSRKFPCKHALGLLLLLAADAGLFKTGDWPAWVAEWAASREKRAERRAAKEERQVNGEAKPVDAAARAKRVAARGDKISAGIAELDLWLRDLVRGGIAGAESRPTSFWDGMAARLVDAQAPGAARLVRELVTIPATRDGWHGRMLADLGRLHLLTTAWARVNTLSPETQADVRAHLGWAMTESELTDLPSVDDDWMVIGQVLDEDERLRVRRTWLHGSTSGRSALLLHFAPGTAPFPELLPPLGSSLAAELVFFPSSHPQRATIRSRRENGTNRPTHARPPGERRLATAAGAYARALALDPWTERVSVVLDGVVPDAAGTGWLIRDEQGDALPIDPHFRGGWTLLAVSGAQPVWISAEWTGRYLLPLAVAHGDSLLPLTA